MFDRFTTEAKDLMNRARQESVRLGHAYLGPEHVLLGMLAMPESTGAAILRACGLDTNEVRAELERLVRPGSSQPLHYGQIPFTPGAKKVLENAMAEVAEASQHGAFSVGHLLIGLASTSGSIPATVLAERGVSVDALRAKVQAGLVDLPGDRPPHDRGRRLHILREAVAVLTVLGESEAAARVREAMDRLA